MSGLTITNKDLNLGARNPGRSTLTQIQSDATETINPRHDAQRYGGQRDSSTTVASMRAYAYYWILLRLHYG